MNDTPQFSAQVLAFLRDMRLSESLALVCPELILVATIVAVVTYDMFQDRAGSFRSGIVALVGTGAAILAAIASDIGGSVVGFSGAFVSDGLTRFLRLIFLGATLLVIVQSLISHEVRRYRQGEYYGVLLTATLGMTFLVGSGNIVIFFLALETLSLCSYILVGYSKGTREAAEASIKYLLYGSLVSGALLFGFSYLYGLSGTIDFPGVVRNPFTTGPSTLMASLGLMMVLGGLFFKTSVAPFHIWTPDIYEGAPTPITGYLSVASKAAGFGAMLRVVLPIVGLPDLQEFAAGAFGSVHVDMRFVFGLLAVLTITIGNFGALRQKNLKRLMAYSSIAHAGYMLMAFSNLNTISRQALLMYLTVYLFMNLGFFLVVVLLENDGQGSATIDDFAGYGRTRPVLACCLTVVLVSLIGLPPTAGFSAKFQLFTGVLTGTTDQSFPWYVLLVLVALLNSVVSLAYYIRPARVLFFSDPKPSVAALADAPTTLARSVLVTLALLGVTLPLVGLFIYWSRVLDAATLAVATFGLH